jgi:glyoxylase-like metal-dependent hydrolase (beta-lactamase superfamily II)
MTPASIITIDTHYEAPGKAAVFLVKENGRAAFIDNNTVHALPYLMAALENNGLKPEAVDYAIITHVHLDHAGGSAALLEKCPNATLLAHPKAARHITDPSRLIKGAQAVYGEADFARLYGGVRGVPEARVRVMADGETLGWGDRALSFFYTLGHATHHFCIHDSGTNSVFTGDSFGLGLSEAVRPGPSFLICSSSPADFDPAEARISVRKILATGADRACLPHFGVHEDMAGDAEKLLRSIDQMEAILEEAINGELTGADLEGWCEKKVAAAMEEHLAACGVADTASDLRWIGEDIGINAMGLAWVAQKRRKALENG